SLPLKPATAYTLKAASRAPSGEETTTVARFRTLAPGQNVSGRMTPDDDGPVPVNQVVSVVFDKPIADRPAVERAFRVTANPAATGKTQWKSDRELVWRPTPAWAPGSQVTVSLDIYGKQLGGNLVGAADLRRSFSVIDDDRGLALRAARSSVPSSSGGSSSSGSSPAPNPGSAPARPDKLPAKPLAEPSTTPTTSAARPRTTTRSATPSTAPKPGATQPSAGPPTTSKPSSSSGSTSGTAGSGQ
ncbi:MAG: Ig-like domain-containing protein, partial [Actinomycetota bacterium]|nr:Ig-like domain-containing protein [Actinomycetota bacterium]